MAKKLDRAGGRVTAGRAADGAAAGGGGTLARIRAHLRAKGVEALVDMIVDLAERDPLLHRKLDRAAVDMQGDDKVLGMRLRRALDSATRTDRFIHRREAKDWAERIAASLDAVAELAGGARAGLALKLVVHAIDRIEATFEDVDDSDGHRDALLHRARDIHVAACGAVRPDPVALARNLFGREMNNDYDTFDRAAAVYAEVLGEAGLAEYRRLARQAWEKLPPRTKAAATPGNYAQLERMLDFFAEREGDIEERVALRSKDLSGPRNYLRLAEFCLEHGRGDEALRRAEEGLSLFEGDGRAEGLVLFAAGLLAKSGRKAEAESHLWRAFERQPGVELYTRLRTLGGTVARDRALAFLEARLAAGEGTSDLLIDLLLREKMLDAAWSALDRYGADPRRRQALADASTRSHADKALAVYAGLVEEHLELGHYEEARRLIALMARLRDPAEQAAYVADVKDRHRRKRNFMKLL